MADSPFYEDFGQSRPQAPHQILPAIAKIGVAGLGGLVAGRLDKLVFDWPSMKPYAAAGTLAVFAAAVAMEYFLYENTPVRGILRQVAAGMGGWVGDDLWYVTLQLLGFGPKSWAPQTPYTMGTEVLHQGVLWIASKNIPYPPQAEPGKDSRWIRRAQGFRRAALDMGDYRQAAQALRDNDEVWNAIACDQTAIFGPDVEKLVSERLGTEFRFTEDQRHAFKQKAKETLSQVVEAFAAA